MKEYEIKPERTYNLHSYRKIPPAVQLAREFSALLGLTPHEEVCFWKNVPYTFQKEVSDATDPINLRESD